MSNVGAGTPDGSDGRAGLPSGDRVSPPARLKIRPDFIRAATGGRVHGRSLSLQVYRRKPADEPVSGPRVGLTVTKKVGNAVVRNRVKRRLREALRTPGLAAMPDHDYVIVARREALSASFAGLTGEIRRCFGDARSGKARTSGRAGGVKAGGPRRGSGAKGGGSPGIAPARPHP